MELPDSTTSITIEPEVQTDPIPGAHNVHVEAVGKSMTLAICFAAKIGGLATITGSSSGVIGYELITE